MKTYKIEKYVTLIVSLLSLNACNSDWLDPKPLSILVPENTFINAEGFEGALTTCRKQLKHEFYGDCKGNATEFMFSDLAVNGLTESDRPHNMDIQITPNGVGECKVKWFWEYCYDGIKYANIVISRIGDAEWKSEDEKNRILGEGYFHRAYYFYRLVHQYGDVPWVGEEITSPRLDFKTYSRAAILDKIKRDLEFSVKWIPENVEPGQVNRAAANFLLTKVYLSLGLFDDAIKSASEIINDGIHVMMTERFGQGRYYDRSEFNVVWDLHQRENKSLLENKEAILVVQDKYGYEGCTDGTWAMRDFEPMYHWAPVKAPNGKAGTSDSGAEGSPGRVWADSVGRGLGRVRPCPYFTTTIWANCNDDLRHCKENWFDITDFVYNNVSAEEWYMEKIPMEHIQAMGVDTIRTLFAFPFYKVNIPDELRLERKPGGNSDWYVFRLAEVYLLRAEAYWWKNDLINAAKDINIVRTRAKADPISASGVTIDYIFDERARELYAEEPRKTELTRVAYIMASLSRDGYTLKTMHQKNWYYDRVIRCNFFYRENILNYSNIYKMSPFHVYWPIPQNAIDANAQNVINQNYGYIGEENRQEPVNLIE